jgi:glycosyltransferase involved in cell wall biosynthesis
VKVVICWTQISGYMAACWRALAAKQDLDARIIAWESEGPDMDVAFTPDLVRGLNARLLTRAEQADTALLERLVVEHDPQVVVISGWAHAAQRALARSSALSRARFIMTMDSPWRGTLRQRLGKYKIARLLSRMDRIIVPGERAWQFARVLGVPERRVRRGMYGFDYDAFAPLLSARRAADDGWPRKLLFVGRYVQDKGIDVLLDAYREYRALVNDAWPLTCCGAGPLASSLRGEPGISDMGFAPPDKLPQILASHGVFVMPSRFEPWGVAIAEAMASGMPVICTEACGASVELLRPMYNGLAVATEDAAALRDAFEWCHHHAARLPELGARGQALAAAFSAQAWAERWAQMFLQLQPQAATEARAC